MEVVHAIARQPAIERATGHREAQADAGKEQQVSDEARCSRQVPVGVVYVVQGPPPPLILRPSKDEFTEVPRPMSLTQAMAPAPRPESRSMSFRMHLPSWSLSHYRTTSRRGNSSAHHSSSLAHQTAQ